MKIFTKWGVFSIFILLIVSFLYFYGISYACKIYYTSFNNQWCFNREYGAFESIALVLLGAAIFVTPLLAPVLFTLPLRSIVFENWMKFALWAGPTVGLITWYLFSVQTSGGVTGAAQDALILFEVVVVYTLYTICSLNIIWYVWRQTKNGKEIHLWRPILISFVFTVLLLVGYIAWLIVNGY